MSMENLDVMMSTGDSSARTLWQFYQLSNLVEKQMELSEEMINMAVLSIFVHTSNVVLTCCKIFRHGVLALLPLRRKAC
jgi:hypothetical protein